MVTESLKGRWIVTAGIIPGDALPNYTRTWAYTSTEYAADTGLGADILWGEILGVYRPADTEKFATIYAQKRREAEEYRRSLDNPNHVNWVRLDWMWL